MENYKTCISSIFNWDFYHLYHGFVISFVLGGHRSMRFHCNNGWLSTFCNLSFIVLTAIQHTRYVHHGLHRNIHYLVYFSVISFQNTFIMCPTVQRQFRIWQYFHYKTLLQEDFNISIKFQFCLNLPWNVLAWVWICIHWVC